MIHARSVFNETMKRLAPGKGTVLPEDAVALPDQLSEEQQITVEQQLCQAQRQAVCGCPEKLHIRSTSKGPLAVP